MQHAVLRLDQVTYEHGYVLLLLMYCSFDRSLWIFCRIFHWHWVHHADDVILQNGGRFNLYQTIKNPNHAQTILEIYYFCPVTFSTKHFQPKCRRCGRRAQVITSFPSSLLYCCEIITSASRDELATGFQCGVKLSINQIQLVQRLLVLLQLDLHSRLNTCLRTINQTINIKVVVFGATFIRGWWYV